MRYEITSLESLWPVLCTYREGDGEEQVRLAFVNPSAGRVEFDGCQIGTVPEDFTAAVMAHIRRHTPPAVTPTVPHPQAERPNL